MVIDSEVNRLASAYGSKLARKEKLELKSILELSKRHTHACSEAVRLFPFEAVLLAVLLEREKMLLKNPHEQ